MAVDYDTKIELIDSNNPITDYNYLFTLPDTCPVCLHSLSPKFILVYDKDRFTTELLCGCPRHDCRSLFIAVYQGDSHTFYQTKLYPYNKKNKEFPIEISELSSVFVDIYNQANHADKEGLDMICGVGYRKALEYLIKDYSIYKNQGKDESIREMYLGQCIKEYIDSPDVKEMAERAVWLGNDETHYVRKWEDKDINDLKNLIDLTVYYISMNLKAEKYKLEMER